MYLEKKVERGYNAYLSVDERNGEGSWMDVGLLVMEKGDRYTFEESAKELSWILIKGRAIARFDGREEAMERPDPFRHNPWCLLMAPGHRCEVEALDYCEFYVQKTPSDSCYETHLYTADEVDTWQRGNDGALDGCMRRDVRTCYDYETRPDSKMVLGEVVNLPGRWSSYPPHSHPQPEVYFYFFERPEGFGAGWTDGQPHEIHHHGCLVVTDSCNHEQVMAPGYPCCYTWGIRHLPGNPWEKTRNDDPVHAWLLEKNPEYWRG